MTPYDPSTDKGLEGTSSVDAEAGARTERGTGWWLFTLHLLTVFGLALSNAFMALAAIWVVARRRNLPRSIVTRGAGGTAWLLLPLAVYAIAFLVAALFSHEPALSFVHGRDILALATIPLALFLVRGEEQTRLVLTLLLLLVGALAAYGLAQTYWLGYEDLHRRPPGPFSHYMTFSGVLLLGLCIWLARVVNRSWRADSRAGVGPVPRWAIWLVGGLLLMALGVTLTRSAWIAALVVITLGVMVAMPRWLPVWLVSALLIAGAVAQFAPQHWERFRSITDLENTSNFDRLCMARAGALMVAERPLFGVGPGVVKVRYPIYREPGAPRWHVVHLHNTIVHMAAERGLVSVAAYLCLMLAGLRLAWRGLRRDGGVHGPRGDLYMATLFGIVALNVAGVFEANWRDTEIQRIILFLLVVPLCATRGRVGGERPECYGADTPPRP